MLPFFGSKFQTIPRFRILTILKDFQTSLSKSIDSIAIIAIQTSFFMAVFEFPTPSVRLPILRSLRRYKRPNIYGFMHVPVQSGSDAVLKHMKRKYSVEEFQHLVDAWNILEPAADLTCWCRWLERQKCGFHEGIVDFRFDLSIWWIGFVYIMKWKDMLWNVVWNRLITSNDIIYIIMQ